jgi:hypothetical protein
MRIILKWILEEHVNLELCSTDWGCDCLLGRRLWNVGLLNSEFIDLVNKYQLSTEDPEEICFWLVSLSITTESQYET